MYLVFCPMWWLFLCQWRPALSELDCRWHSKLSSEGFWPLLGAIKKPCSIQASSRALRVEWKLFIMTSLHWLYTTACWIYMFLKFINLYSFWKCPLCLLVKWFALCSRSVLRRHLVRSSFLLAVLASDTFSCIWLKSCSDLLEREKDKSMNKRKYGPLKCKCRDTKQPNKSIHQAGLQTLMWCLTSV